MQRLLQRLTRCWSGEHINLVRRTFFHVITMSDETLEGQAVFLRSFCSVLCNLCASLELDSLPSILAIFLCVKDVAISSQSCAQQCPCNRDILTLGFTQCCLGMISSSCVTCSKIQMHWVFRLLMCFCYVRASGVGRNRDLQGAVDRSAKPLSGLG